MLLVYVEGYHSQASAFKERHLMILVRERIIINSFPEAKVKDTYKSTSTSTLFVYCFDAECLWMNLRNGKFEVIVSFRHSN